MSEFVAFEVTIFGIAIKVSRSIIPVTILVFESTIYIFKLSDKSMRSGNYFMYDSNPAKSLKIYFLLNKWIVFYFVSALYYSHEIFLFVFFPLNFIGLKRDGKCLYYEVSVESRKICGLQHILVKTWLHKSNMLQIWTFHIENILSPFRWLCVILFYFFFLFFILK